MNNVMIDIETLALSNDAAVIAVGACAFDANAIGGRFEVLLNPVLSPGRRDEETLEWWCRQPAEVLERVTGGLATPREACVGTGGVRSVAGSAGEDLGQLAVVRLHRAAYAVRRRRGVRAVVLPRRAGLSDAEGDVQVAPELRRRCDRVDPR